VFIVKQTLPYRSSTPRNASTWPARANLTEKIGEGPASHRASTRRAEA